MLGSGPWIIASRRGTSMPGKPVALAKLTRPKLLAGVDCARLVRLLDDRLARSTVWVTGPPGAGKTTLLAGYADARNAATLWYHLDGGDADVASFFHYLGIAAQGFSRGRQRAEALPILVPEYLPDLMGFARRYFRDLFARLPRPSLLAFDDYHDVPPGAPLHDVLACALAELPDGVRCVVASRAEPPSEFARMTANQAIVPLGWDDLRLTEEEAAHIARRRQVTDDAIIRSAHQRSDGWVAGLLLLLDQQPKATAATAAISPSSRLLFDYFSDVFARSVSSAARDVLLDCVHLSSMTGRIAARLSGHENAGQLLRELHEQNCFIHCRSVGELRHRAHPLFRDFLLDLVSRRDSPVERIERIRRTADALAEHDEPEEATALYGEAGDWTRVVDLTLASAPSLLSQGRWQTLQARIAAIPPEVARTAPWLSYWLGASQMAVDPLAAAATLERAHEEFSRIRNGLGQMLAAATRIEVEFILWSDFRSLDRWIEALEAPLSRGEPFPDATTEARVLSSLVQALTFHAPWHAELGRYAERLLALAESAIAPTQRLLAAAALSHHFGWLGHAELAQRTSAIARPLLAHKDIPPASRIFSAMSLAYAAYARADHEGGAALFAQAFALVEEHGLDYIGFWMHAAECWHKLDRGEYKAVASTLGKLEAALTAGRGMDVAHFHLVKGWLALLEGRFVLAQQEVETAHELAGRAGANFTESYHVLMLAEVSIELADHAQAKEWVARYRATFGGVVSPVIEFNALLVDAYGALKEQDDARCTVALREAFLLARTNGYVTTFNWYGRMMARLGAFALEHDIEADYVRYLIARRQLTPETPLEIWPWPVRFHTLGRFEVRVNDDVLRFEGKAQHKPMALAKALIALGGRDVPAYKLVDILWPETADGDGHKAFDITVHRLRKLLGSDDAVQVADRHVTLDPRSVWVDAWALELALAPLMGASNGPQPDIARLEAAAPQVLRLYRGHFLAGDPEEAWQIPFRNRLTGRFQRFALRLGEHWEIRQQWTRAFELYQRVVELDPLAESFYRRQMICLQALGQRAEALEVFRRCRQVLSVTLGVAPTDETERVHRQLLAS